MKPSGTRPRYVYFARASDMMKIGCSVQPLHRLASIGEWVPHKITLVATIPGGFDLEANFHAHFADEWSHLEWFHVTPRMMQVVDDINAGRPIKLETDYKSSAKYIQRRLKFAATRRISCAEDRAGRPYLYPERQALRPQYIIDAILSFRGGDRPPPDEAALAAIARYERELEAERAA